MLAMWMVALVAHGELVVAGGRGPVVLEVAEAAFHGAAVLVRDGVEGQRASAT